MKIDLTKVKDIDVEADTLYGGGGRLNITINFLDGTQLELSDIGDDSYIIEKKEVDEFNAIAETNAV